MAARERRPQQKPERELPVDINIDKEKLKNAFDLSHFDINAILRGVELTMVGGRCGRLSPESSLSLTVQLGTD